MSAEQPRSIFKDSQIIRRMRATMLLGSSNNEISQDPQYIEALPQFEELYTQTWRWHGTGRYQYTPPDYQQQRDVIQGIIENKGLVPHRDPLDYTKGVMYSISTSPSRLYSSLYAQLHYEKGQRLRNPLITAYGWTVFMNAIAGKDRRLMSKKFRQNVGLTQEATQYFHQKYTHSNVTPSQMVMGGQSDISSNHPILIGIKENAFPEADIAEVLQKHESRATTPISIYQFTHIEVPLANVSEVRDRLYQQGDSHLPVIPIEWGEEYSKTLPISWIIDGQI